VYELKILIDYIFEYLDLSCIILAAAAIHVWQIYISIRSILAAAVVAADIVTYDI